MTPPQWSRFQTVLQGMLAEKLMADLESLWINGCPADGRVWVH